jgi:flagellar basal body-associated protein FliL
MNKTALIITVLVVVALASAGVYFFTTMSVEKAEAPLAQNTAVSDKPAVKLEEKLTLYADLNPVENLPEPNPFETQVNPFDYDEGDLNPFSE